MELIIVFHAENWTKAGYRESAIQRTFGTAFVVMNRKTKNMQLFRALAVSLCTAFIWAANSQTIHAGTASYARSVLVFRSLVGQLPTRNAVRDATKATDLLRQARQAMQQNEFDRAESLIRQAEALNVKFDTNLANYADTPERLREELDAMKNGRRFSWRPGNRLLPSLLSRRNQKKMDIPQDPFPLQNQEQQFANLMDNSKGRAKDYLEKGRVALAQGNVSGAVAWYQKAVALDVGFNPGEYNPGQLLEELQRAGVRDVEKMVGRINPLSSDRFQTLPLVNTEIPSRLSSAASDVNIDNETITNPFAQPFVGANTSGDKSGMRSIPSGRGLISTLPGTNASAHAEPNMLNFDTGYDEPANQSASKKRLLLQARLMLAAGHVERAEELVRKAASASNVNLPNGDSPDKVQSLIGKYRTVESTLSSVDASVERYQKARLYMDQSSGLLSHGDYAAARYLAEQARHEGAEFGRFERTPDQLLRRIERAEATGTRSSQTRSLAPLPGNFGGGNDGTSAPKLFSAPASIGLNSSTSPGSIASAALELSSDSPPDDVVHALYDPDVDNSHDELATANSPGPLTIINTIPEAPTAEQLIRKGEQALANNDVESARSFFLRALPANEASSPALRQQLQTRLQMVESKKTVSQTVGNNEGETSLEGVRARQTALWRQWSGEVTTQTRQAERLKGEAPVAALQQLQGLEKRVAQSDLSRSARRELASRVGVRIRDLEKYIEENRADIELDEQNKRVLEEIKRDRELDGQIQNKLADLVEEFNQLIDQERWSEAELIARKARQIDPENPITESMAWKSSFISRYMRNRHLQDRSEVGFVKAMDGEGAIPFDDSQPFQFPDADKWRQYRKRSGVERRTHLSESELEIQRRLKTPVEVRFNNRPLSEVMETLANLTNVNLFLDPEGMAAEGVTSSEPVTINLTGKPISLKSALALILQPLHLSYVIQNEVLKITSEQMRESQVYQEVYYVADLVIPIPNFSPNQSFGVPAAMSAQHGAYGRGYVPGLAQESPVTPVSYRGSEGMPNDSSILGQVMAGGVPMPGQIGGSRGPVVMGSGGLGGAAQADFDSLIQLITTTISPNSWEEVGGPGAIQDFEGTLSLVVSQTQDVHDQIVDLLEQLRKLQDLQVTIEVRFITLRDDFFERIGIDFDFDINDNTGLTNADLENPPRSITVGLDPLGDFTPDLDLSFTQGSFTSTVPQFGGFDAATAANFGFAILSDIEAYFMIQAAQGDERSNVLQAPKVTLFNGQQASINDSSMRPFVTGIIPVVGDFAAAQQPVITVLSEGTSLSVQAVVSPDRRFVRLTMVPFFSEIGAVKTFTFTGRTTSNTGTAAVDPADDTQSVQNEAHTITEGSTVQLPEFIVTSVATTVSVPDGGTVLLGGIKRLQEGRTERGVPMLDKLPYINRLFKNVGIGRTTKSLMLMVTPRIIIQEEEEELLLGGKSP